MKRRKIIRISIIAILIVALIVGLFSCIGRDEKVKKSDNEKDFVAENLLPDLPEYDEEDETKEESEEVVVSNSKSTNRKKSDSKYTSKPKTNAEVYGAANDKAIEESQKNAQDKEAAEEAQKEAADKPIEIVIPEDTDKNEGSSNTENNGNTEGTTGDTNKDEEGKVIPVDTNVSQTKEPERVIVTDDGSLNVIKESDYQENKKQEESSDDATETDELGREVVEIIIPFGDETDTFTPAVVSVNEIEEEAVETAEVIEETIEEQPVETVQVEESVETEDNREVIEMVIEW